MLFVVPDPELADAIILKIDSIIYVCPIIFMWIR